MRRSGNIFDSKNYSVTSKRMLSGVAVVTIVLSLLSVVVAIYIITHFDKITARIALWVANFLSSGFPILILILVFVYFIMRLKWKVRRHFWGW